MIFYLNLLVDFPRKVMLSFPCTSMSLLESFDSIGQLWMKLVLIMLEKSSADIELIRIFNFRTSSARCIFLGGELKVIFYYGLHE